MPEAQLNLRVPHTLATALRVDAIHRGVRPRDVLVELLEAKYGVQGPPEPLNGQLTVDETQEPSAVTPAPDRSEASTVPGNATPASRRPRAAKPAKRSRKGTPPVDNPGDSRPSSAGGDPAGCPECGADVQHGKCVDCGWIA